MLASPQFAEARRMQRFLEYVVRQTLEGAAADIKEYAIGVEVFDRPDDYDPRIDSIVRVEARRLRRKLREYYAGPGKHDDLVISLPEGSYVPSFSGPGAAQVTTPPATRPQPGEPRLAVLPLETIPAGDDARMLGDALMDDLLGALAKLPGLRVVTRSAALRFKEPERDLKSIAAELSVEWVFEGALRRSGDKWRLSAHLAECATGYARWSETYMAGTVEIQTLYAQVAREVAAHLGVTQPKPAAQPDSESTGLAGFKHLLQARHLMLQMTPRSLALAAQAFRRAFTVDPTLAPAWAGHAGSLLLTGLFGEASPNMVKVDVLNSLNQALILSPELPQVHAWRGFHRATYEWDWDAAEEDFLHALQINPNFFLARLWLAGAVYAPLCRFDEAREQMVLARKLDAASPVLGCMEGLMLAFSGDLEGGLNLLASARRLSQTFYGAHHITARVLAAQGDYRQALEFLEAARPRAVADPRNFALIAAMQAGWVERRRHWRF